MKKFRILICVSFVTISFDMCHEIAQAMPRRLKGIKLASVSLSSASSSSTSLARSSSTSSSLPTQVDGSLPSSSSLPALSSSAVDPAVRPKSYSQALGITKTTAVESNTTSSLTERLSTLSLTTGEEGTKLVTITETTTKVVSKSESLPWRTRGYALAKDILPGEALYKPTFFEGVRVEGEKRRPHLVVDNRPKDGDSDYIVLTILDMSKAKGKEEKYLGSKLNYLINPETSGFNGDNTSFVKLNRPAEIVLPADLKQRLARRTVGAEDMKEIRKRLGFKD